MRIAINCADLDHNRIDGTRVYIKKCLDYFGALDSYSVFILYHKTKFNPELKPKIYSNYRDEAIPYPIWWVQTRLGFELNYTLPDACWMPIQQVPFLADRKTKIIITIHDLAFKYFPQHFPWRDRLKLDFFTDTAVKRADKIIAVSEATKQDILKFYPKTKKEKIKVIYHGVEKESFSRKFSSEKARKVLKRYDIKREYLLYVGALQPRKNLETLVEAFEKLKKNGDKKTQLVLAGVPAWKAEKILAKIEKSKFNRDIVLTGKVSFEDLPIIYQKAQMFISPSLYEGFGIPLLEAWASQIPVIVANNSSLKEIGGEGVLRFETLDSDELLKKINILLKRDTIRKELIKKGTKRLEKFSWEKCAKKTLKLIKQK
ncbi:MAG: glycosyltransferase family 4 protein [Candidatus Moranbacteria bacterium]|nr:glycosyltransferase family 4 protein [Candidatus Moranbacteria bacterium]